ncbi:hypothetical protein ABZ137_14620 [Streptomyces bobili]|uniref:hypothetical protein n=1 Tax=Streptomyces bobili TaxID=67280 RepID=UPI0033BB5BD8
MSSADMDGTPELPVGTQLNQFPADPGSGGGNGGLHGPYLASSPAAKKAAAKSIEEHIAPDTRTAGDVADASTTAAVKAFSAKDAEGWVTSGALKGAHETWGRQVTALLNRLNGEKEALLATNTLLSGTDFQVGAGVRQIPSSFDTY